MTINEVQDEIIEEFCELDDWMDRYQLLIDLGEVSLVIRVVNHHTPQEILDANLYFIDKIGLTEHLSPTRSNGLLAMIKQVRMYALAYKTKLGE